MSVEAGAPRLGAGRLRLAAALASPLLAGLALRAWNLDAQVLGGDELHAVRAAVHLAPAEVLTRYGIADYSLPLTAIYAFLLRHGVTVGELALRLPSLLAGTAALLVLPLALARRLGHPAAALYAWLLALSPLLVLYSRIARSYLPMTLCAIAAVAAFGRWWEGGGRRWAAAYVALAAAALWLHLGAGPLLVAPFAFAAGDALSRRGSRGAALLRLAGVALAVAAAWLAFLLPAHASLLRLVAAKRQGLVVSPAAAWDAARLLAGAASPLAAVAFWGLAAAGAALLVARHRRFGLLTVTAAAGHVAGLAVLAPRGLGSALVMTRYLLPVLPLALLWVAFALAWPWRRGAAGGDAVAARAAAVLAVVALFAAGPLPRLVAARGSFDHHNLGLDFTAPRPELAAADAPAVYTALGPGAIVELPWSPRWSDNRTAPLYQRLHRREVMVSAVAGMPRHPHLRLRNEVAPEPAALLGCRARWLLVHRRLAAEEERLAAAAGLQRPRVAAEDRRLLQRSASRLVSRLVRLWGPPDHADEWVAAWDLERLRREGAPVAAQPRAEPSAATTASASSSPRVASVSRPSAADAAAGSPK